MADGFSPDSAAWGITCDRFHGLCFRSGHSQSKVDSPLCIVPHGVRSPNKGVPVDVLVSVDESPWLCPFDVAGESLKADGNLGAPLGHVTG